MCPIVVTVMKRTVETTLRAQAKCGETETGNADTSKAYRVLLNAVVSSQPQPL